MHIRQCIELVDGNSNTLMTDRIIQRSCVLTCAVSGVASTVLGITAGALFYKGSDHFGPVFITTMITGMISLALCCTPQVMGAIAKTDRAVYDALRNNNKKSLENQNLI